MAAVAAVFDGGSSVQRRSMALVMDYDERTIGREGGARTGNTTTSQHDERTRGWCVCNLDSGGGRPFAILEDNNPRCTCRPRLVIVLLELKSSKDPHS